MSQKSLPLERLIGEAYRRLEHLRYSANTRTFYRRSWQALLRWSQEHGVQNMTSDVANQFLESIGIPSGKPPEPLSRYHSNIRASIRVLEDFALYGHWRIRHPLGCKPSFPPNFEREIEEFLKYQEVICGLSPQTLGMARHHLFLFTSFLESCNIERWIDLRPGNITAFFTSTTPMQTISRRNLSSPIRKFLKYLWLQQLHSQDLSIYLPQFAKRQQHISSVWQQKDVDALLSVVDKGSALGKRDYAVLLLATRLGLRAGEIRTLKLENIHWESSQLEIFQFKTGNTLVLPLSEEIGEALIDYLRYGRPPAACREVFVRHMAPFVPFNKNFSFYNMINTYRKKARIRMDVSRGRGLHSLRYTLATRLLEQETPIETIAAVLGHKSLETTLIYTKVSVTILRSAALDPEDACHE